MVSADCHFTEGLGFIKGIEAEYADRTPRVEVRDDDSQWMITEGNAPMMVKPGRRSKTVQDQQSFETAADNRHAGSRMEDEDVRRMNGGKSVEQRLADQLLDGIDAEIQFPTTGLLCWATPDPVFAMAMCRAWNRWALETCGANMQGDNPKFLSACLGIRYPRP